MKRPILCVRDCQRSSVPLRLHGISLRMCEWQDSPSKKQYWVSGSGREVTRTTELENIMKKAGQPPLYADSSPASEQVSRNMFAKKNLVHIE
jgi:hypothetical protein